MRTVKRLGRYIRHCVWVQMEVYGWTLAPTLPMPPDVAQAFTPKPQRDTYAEYQRETSC